MIAVTVERRGWVGILRDRIKIQYAVDLSYVFCLKNNFRNKICSTYRPVDLLSLSNAHIKACGMNHNRQSNKDRILILSVNYGFY